jgi:uncharacterized membrane protein
MAVLILGLVLFLGIHSLRIFAPAWRDRQVARLGAMPWKGLYSAASIVGFVLICYGFGQARLHPVMLYGPPAALRHLNGLFVLVASILLFAAYVPNNHLKARFGHPMLLAVKVWAIGHLLATGMQYDVVLFGAFLAWALVDFIVSRRRDRALGVTYSAGSVRGDAITVLLGIVFFMVFAFFLHTRLIGVNPFA